MLGECSCNGQLSRQSDLTGGTWRTRLTAHTQFVCVDIDAAVLKKRDLFVAKGAAGGSDRVVVTDAGARLGIYALHASRHEGVRAIRVDAGQAMRKLAKVASMAAGGASGAVEVSRRVRGCLGMG
jgi:hypothetical protein